MSSKISLFVILTKYLPKVLSLEDYHIKSYQYILLDNQNCANADITLFY